MTDFEKDVIDRLGRIETKQDTIEQKLDNDDEILHGNGKPGLLDRVTALEMQSTVAHDNSGKIDNLNTRLDELEVRISALSLSIKTDKDWIGRIRESIGQLITAAIAIYAAFFR